jgi:hypothetical protein
MCSSTRTKPAPGGNAALRGWVQPNLSPETEPLYPSNNQPIVLVVTGCSARPSHTLALPCKPLPLEQQPTRCVGCLPVLRPPEPHSYPHGQATPPFGQQPTHCVGCNRSSAHPSHTLALAGKPLRPSGDNQPVMLVVSRCSALPNRALALPGKPLRPSGNNQPVVLVVAGGRESSGPGERDGVSRGPVTPGVGAGES